MLCSIYSHDSSDCGEPKCVCKTEQVFGTSTKMRLYRICGGVAVLRTLVDTSKLKSQVVMTSNLRPNSRRPSH